jgi:hypothetical protein
VISEVVSPPGSRIGLKYPLGLLLVKSSRHNSSLRRSEGSGYRSIYKYPEDPLLKEGDWHNTQPPQKTEEGAFGFKLGISFTSSMDSVTKKWHRPENETVACVCWKDPGFGFICVSPCAVQVP